MEELSPISRIRQFVLNINTLLFVTWLLACGFLVYDQSRHQQSDISQNSLPDLIKLPETTSYTPNHNLNLTLPEPPTVKNDNNFNIDYDYPPIPQALGTVRIPVLNYHQVAELPDKKGTRDYYVSPSMFERQMEYLKAKNYKTLSMQEFYELLKIGKNPTQKSILITFDDGNKNNYTNAFPILKKYGFKATFFIVSSRSGFTSTQQREMVAAGMDIESHSATHRDLVKLSGSVSDLTAEVINSKGNIEYMSGSKVISISYPGCTANSETFAYMRSAGYALGFTCGKKIDHKLGGAYVLQRLHVYSNFENFKQRLSGIVEYTSIYE